MSQFRRSYTGHSDASHVDNFSVKSRSSNQPMREERDKSQTRKRERKESGGRPRGHLINGVDFYGGEVVVGRRGELLADAFSVKGDYFYLKAGETVGVRAAVGEYVEVRLGSRVGYFPARLIRLTDGEVWKEGRDLRGWEGRG